MAPGALYSQEDSLRRSASSPTPAGALTIIKRCLLNRSINVNPLRLARGVGNSWYLADGTEIYDASGGAAVASIGKRNKRVERATHRIEKLGLSYAPSLGFDTDITEELATWMIRSTAGLMSKAVFYCSGSEAVEAAIKIAVQYHKEKPEPQPGKTLFIARQRSYHGATLGALDLSGHDARKRLYTEVLAGKMRLVPECHEYRNKIKGQSDAEYVQWHRKKLIEKIEEFGANRIAGFILEPVVGAALGCAPAVPGYLTAMREVCDDYGVLLIFDEIMCGMGRTGYLHAWQEENVVPDIQVVGKGLAGGFEAVSAMMIGHKVINAFRNGSSNGAFAHGQTFQNSPKGAAAALETQRIVVDEKLLENVRDKGPRLQQKIRERLGHHRYVGDIRGPKKGIFLALEFVRDKASKTPFEESEGIAMKIFSQGLTKAHGIHVYPGSGSVDGLNGDHIILAPAYNITNAEVDLIVDRTTRLVEVFFDNYDRSRKALV
ncbi:pyridoxal phosphate-dependent transferase [Ampelomyces quisqualis]|uniref:Pyridoxal phosphate-dependent transferase n=1 Tax=Ampelomyces quisqualis TaxID=50730 RepID=A0A6A5QGL0_AMPQU|nr:pyridoxal phosphate-dependent transferase [Ampelomyces quisqualis]